MADTIGHYEIVERLGAGGLGEVFRARDTKLGRTVAIKIVESAIAGDPDARAALLADARAVTQLSHPSIAALYDAGEDGDRVFLVFEFVPGTTLRSFMGERPLNPKRAIDLATQLADALAAGHAHGHAHGDVNPETIMVTPTGRAKLLDFGLSRWTAGGRARANAATAESEGRMLGSLAYMSPEQALGGGVDHRTDVFSLGCVLYEMLTGVSPFAKPGNESTVIQILQLSPPSPSSLNPRVPSGLDRIVQQSLIKSLDRREPSIASLSAGLKRLAPDLDVPIEDTIPPPVSATPARSWRWLRLLLLLVVVLALMVAAWRWRDDAINLWRQISEPIESGPTSEHGPITPSGGFPRVA